MKRLIFLSGLIFLVFLADFCLAGIPKIINYQGMLTDNSGNPLTDTVNITFKIYDDPTGGYKKWEETQNNVGVINGLFNVILGSETPIDTLSFSQEYWLDVTVEAEHMPTRLKFTSTAYSFRAENAEAVKGISASTTPTANSLFPLGSDARFPEVVIPPDLPPGPHDHIGEVWSTAIPWSNSAFKVYNSLNGPSIWGVNTGGGNAIRGNGYGSGMGLYAESESVTAAICRGENKWGMEVYGNDASNGDRLGDLLLGGNIGEIFCWSHLGIYADHDVYIDLDDDNNDANAKFAIFDGADVFLMTVKEDGDLWAAGTKSAMVQTANHGQRLLYTMESPEVWFEDLGKASLVNGETTVAFESIFAEAANLQVDYHVFLTPLCQEPVLLFVTDKDAKSFTVRGVTLNGQPTDCTFDYRVVAKRLGYEQVRLEPVSIEETQKGSTRK
ncbi:MAG: hypothetical protein ABII96_06485 [Candidatus Zixiibacteriota bacterium]